MRTVEASASTRFREVEVRGPPRDLGRQIGEATREQFPGLIDHVMMRMNQDRSQTVSVESALEASRGFFPFVEDYSPDSIEELRGVAEGAGVFPEAVMLINARHEVATALSPIPAASEACTSLAVNAEASATATGAVGQNWDNDPGMVPFSLVLTRRPAGKPAFMTFTQPGVIAYMGLSDAGIGVCMNALPGRSRPIGLPWYFTVRGVYEATDLDGAVAAIRRGRRARSGNLAMMTPQGAADLEVQIDSVRVLRADQNGRIVHTNHYLHPESTGINDEFADSLYGQTFEREQRSRELFARSSGAVSVSMLQEMLSDHDGAPTSICRHPNDDPKIGWQRSVVSMIVEPSKGKMYLTRGNPCENPYEVYSLN